MGDLADKIVAGVLIACTLLFLFYQVSTRQGIEPQLSLAQSREIFTELGGSVNAKPVLVFETDWCPVCKSLRQGLQQESIPFHAVNIEKNSLAMVRYQTLLAGKRGGVPLTMVGQYVVLGYQMAKIQRAYREIP